MRSGKKDFEFANKLIIEVGDYIENSLNLGYKTDWKSNNTPVTEIDTGVNDMVINKIHQAYPEDKIYGEEGSLEGSSGYTWVLDPLDGTQALGLLPTFTCCLALIGKDGQAIFGLVYNPSSKELFSAYTSEPSTVNGHSIHVSEKGQIKGSYIFLGSRISIENVPSNGTIYDQLESQGAKILNTRSLAFSCLMVASGKAEGAYVAMKTPFEAASVKLLVENAGGKVTDLFGNNIGRLDGEINGMLVSNSVIHQSLLTALELPNS